MKMNVYIVGLHSNFCSFGIDIFITVAEAHYSHFTLSLSTKRFIVNSMRQLLKLNIATYQDIACTTRS